MIISGEYGKWFIIIIIEILNYEGNVYDYFLLYNRIIHLCYSYILYYSFKLFLYKKGSSVWPVKL